jgi:hypothetical protein
MPHTGGTAGPGEPITDRRVGLSVRRGRAENVVVEDAAWATRSRDERRADGQRRTREAAPVTVVPDALDQALRRAALSEASVLGEYEWDRWHKLQRFGTHCLLLQPGRVWHDPISIFEDSGDPSVALLQSCQATGLTLSGFPFLRDGYILHRGRGTLAQGVASDDRTNRHYDWALEHHQAHFGLVLGAAQRYRELTRRSRAEVPSLDVNSLVCACARR